MQTKLAEHREARSKTLSPRLLNKKGRCERIARQVQGGLGVGAGQIGSFVELARDDGSPKARERQGDEQARRRGKVKESSRTNPGGGSRRPQSVS